MMEEPWSILASERIGVINFLDGVALPIKCNRTDDELRELGFDLSGPIDEVLRGAVLPLNWRIRVIDDADPRHMEIRDGDDVQRARIFLKTTSYDYYGIVNFIEGQSGS